MWRCFSKTPNNSPFKSFASNINLKDVNPGGTKLAALAKGLNFSEIDLVPDEKMNEMNTYLLGSENAGRNFYSHFGIHQATGKEIPGWKITELKDPIKKDQFLTSLQEADMQTARAIGVDVSLANISTQSNSMGAGSGSDKRVGMDNTISASYAEQMIVLKPLRTVGIVNGWPSNVKWTFEHIVPTTLNENKSGTKTV
jgi:hypothetical protein